ncbi:AI-2E family transporter [Candidatus Pacebacteria bacterium]|nr:AI-2E family transporter [Candidatus Paceibacterota bacterium]
MLTNRIVEYVFFFGLMGVVAYLVWQMLAPFVSALALAAIIVTISYPLYLRIVDRMPRQNETVGALLSTLLVFLVIFLPLVFIASALVNEAVSVYRIVGAEQVGFETALQNFEDTANNYIPGFELNVTEYLKQSASYLAGNLGAIFAGTASTIFLFFIAMIGSFYLFRDGKQFTKRLVAVSPLPDDEDDIILERMASSLRAVLTGTVLVAIIQGTLTALGLWLFGFERAVLWGVIASFGALIPSVGTSIVFIPSVVYLLVTGQYIFAAGLSVWGLLAVGLIDNLLGPYLMSRGNAMHPFIILLSVLGGIAFFGPIGFIVGPVVVTLFMVLLELYAQHIAQDDQSIS